MCRLAASKSRLDKFDRAASNSLFTAASCFASSSAVGLGGVGTVGAGLGLGGVGLGVGVGFGATGLTGISSFGLTGLGVSVVLSAGLLGVSPGRVMVSSGLGGLFVEPFL